jgi:sugar lactone lactonase YvrE
LAVVLTAGLLAVIAAPSASAYIYWADVSDGAGGTIGRANNDGTGVDRNFITGLKQPCGVAVDGQHIYWGDGGTNSIGRANLDGSGVDIAWIIQPATVEGPCGVAVDAASIWWANIDGAGGQGSVARANIDGTGAQPLTFNSPTFAKNPFSIALAGNLVYWSNLDLANSFAASAVGRAGADGTPPPTASFLAIGAPGAPQWLAADATHLYLTEILSGVPVQIVRTDLDGTNAQQVISAFPGGGLAVNDGTVYWANGSEGTISSFNPDDGTKPDFAFITQVGEPSGLAVDSGVPSNEFAIGTLTRDKQHGTATLELSAGDPGTFSLAGSGLKPATADVDGGSSVTLTMAAAGKAKTHLKRDGKIKLTADVTFTAIGNATPTSQQVPVKLVRKR